VSPRRVEPVRCAWAAGNDARMTAYHDDEWGVPQHDDVRLYEKICLEGAQAGLSWKTILDKREGYRRAFAGFDPKRVARFTPSRVDKLLLDPGIVRNRAKIESAIQNAKAVLRVQQEAGSLDAFLWGYVDGRPIRNSWKRMDQIPAQTALSLAISKDLKKRGFRFVGPTTVYALMQSVGMVNDHVVTCFRHAELT
jgi:DNA-3-methyladenine glycosylase I